MKDKLSKFIVLSILIITSISIAQENLILSVSEFMTWSPSSPLTVPENVSTEQLRERVADPNNHSIQGLNPDIKVLYCPDWINNWVPEIDVFEPFNKFFISQWQYIDILVWFHGGGIVIPKGPWVNAAHKNGVKVIGTVMFYPNTPGLTSLLARDSNDNYLAVPILIEMAEFYGFDGWFFNIEQSSTSANATKMLELMAEYKEQSNESLELIWYDAMTESGSVSYQNALNSNNDSFFENSSGLFTNYWWGSTHIGNSVSHAQSMGLSEFNIYTGADMWPGRNHQTAFTDITWLDWICTSGTNNLRTSLGLFAMNFPYEWTDFSNFMNDPNDYISCYQTERNIFSGDNLNPFVVEDNTFKGISNYISPKTVITDVPFSTSFNTGHGLHFWNEGVLSYTVNWYDMSQQEILPTWTFYRNLDNQFELEYDFIDAYNGGTSLKMKGENGSLLDNETFKLFKTSITSPNDEINLNITAKYNSNDNLVNTSILCYFSSGNLEEFSLTNNGSADWFTEIYQINIPTADTLIAIGFKIDAEDNALTNLFELNIGKIELISSNSIDAIIPSSFSLDQNYPNPFNPVTKINYRLPVETMHASSLQSAEIVVYNSLGQQVWFSPVTRYGMLPVTGSILFDGSAFNSGVYYYSLVVDGKKIDTKAMILIK